MKRRITAVLLSIVIVLSFSQYVFAENEGEGQINKEASGQGLYAQSPHAILLDMNTGLVLYRKDADARVYPADLTKIMTAVLVLENCNLEELATASETALSNVSAGDSKLGIIKEERLSVRQLLYAMLLGSAADASNVLAEKTSGSIENFVSLMNERAKELGMNNTNFTNPNGEHDERHYTTAEDMSKLTVHAMSINEFREIVKCDSYSIPATEKSDVARKVTNRNHFVSRLLRNDYYYKYSTGIKTGYSTEAKSCIAASALKNGIELLALVFEAETKDNVAQSFKDCSNMFDFVFENYVLQNVVNEGEIVAQTEVENTRRNNKLILKTGSSLSVLHHKNSEKLEVTYKDNFPRKVSAPIKEKELVGTREYFIGNESIGIVNLEADKNYALDPVTFVVNKMLAFVTSPWLFLTLAVMVFLLVMIERRRRRILRKKRRDARRMRNQEMLRQMEKIDI